ncbi:unnamed protein product, partial [Amoebophrya sp. A120]
KRLKTSDQVEDEHHQPGVDPEDHDHDELSSGAAWRAKYNLPTSKSLKALRRLSTADIPEDMQAR